MSAVKNTILVEDSKLLGFVMIQMLNRIPITSQGKAVFSRLKLPMRAVIKIDESNFTTEFNKNIKIWTLTWKWSNGLLP